MPDDLEEGRRIVNGRQKPRIVCMGQGQEGHPCVTGAVVVAPGLVTDPVGGDQPRKAFGDAVHACYLFRIGPKDLLGGLKDIDQSFEQQVADTGDFLESEPG